MIMIKIMMIMIIMSNNNINKNSQWHFQEMALLPLFPDRIEIWSVGF